jgi:endo-1,4-beta-mannosidase
MNLYKISFWRLATLFTFFVTASYCQDTGKRYLPKDLSNIRGFNYTAATAKGHPEMWLGYLPEETEREMDMARKLNLNQVRVFVPYAPYISDKEAYRKNLLHFVRTCHASDIGVMPVVGYSQEMLMDSAYRPQAREWVAFLVSTLLEEPRIAIWDIKNEPVSLLDLRNEQENRGSALNPKFTFLRYISGVFHELDKKHPITIGMASEPPMERFGDCVDILSFHDYSSTREQIRAMIGRAKKYAARVNKPLINSEIGCVGRANPYDMAIEEYMNAGG